MKTFDIQNGDVQVMGFWGIDERAGDAKKFKMAENVSGIAGASVKTRGRRAAVRSLYNGEGFFGDDTLAYVDGGKLYYGALEITGVNLSPGQKTILKMGQYLMIFPDEVYVDINNTSKYGSMNSTFSAYGGGVAVVDTSGNTITYTTVSELPKDASEDTYCVVKEDGAFVMKRYNGKIWNNVKTYVKIFASGIGGSFAVGDVVYCTGLSFVPQKYFTIVKRDNSALYYEGVIDKTYAVNAFSIKRVVPTFDYVTVSGNRLVGVRRGKDKSGNYVSRMYVSRLNDPFNFAPEGGGLVADIDICGTFTGVCDYLGSPVAFSESEIIEARIKNATLITTLIKGYGVESGAHKSIAQTRGALYYKSRHGVCRYDGSYPELISEDIGNLSLSKNGSPAIALGEKYYICASSDLGTAKIYVYDVNDRIWYAENETDVMDFAICKGHIYALCGFGQEFGIVLMDYDGASEDMRSYLVQDGYFIIESDVSWSLESAEIGSQSFEGVCPIKIALRIKKNEGKRISIGVLYDGEAGGETATVFEAASGTVTVPITPRRCDSFRIIVSGEGEAEIFGLMAQYREGGQVKGWK